MSQRAKERTKRPASREKGTQAEGPQAATGRADLRVKTLEQERDRLKKELEAAQSRIAALEENRSAVAGRIDWVIESLNGIVGRSE